MSDTSDGAAVVVPERHEPGQKRNPFARLALFYRQVIAELRKVVWPGRKQLVTYTTVVIAFVCVIMVFVTSLDLALNKVAFWVFA